MPVILNDSTKAETHDKNSGSSTVFLAPIILCMRTYWIFFNSVSFFSYFSFASHEKKTSTDMYTSIRIMLPKSSKLLFVHECKLCDFSYNKFVLLYFLYIDYALCNMLKS